MIKLHPSGNAPEGCFFMRFRREAAAVASHYADGYRNSALLISHFNFYEFRCSTVQVCVC